MPFKVLLSNLVYGPFSTLHLLR